MCWQLDGECQGSREHRPWGWQRCQPRVTLWPCASPQYGRCIRSALRQEKGLSAIADLLTHDSERVVKAASGALRNLAVDLRNKELIGEGCMLPVSMQARQEIPPPLGSWGCVWGQHQPSLCPHPEQRVPSFTERESKTRHLSVVFPSVLFPACSRPAPHPSQANMPSPTL